MFTATHCLRSISYINFVSIKMFHGPKCAVSAIIEVVLRKIYTIVICYMVSKAESTISPHNIIMLQDTDTAH